MAKPCVWIIGDQEPAIFSSALEWLQDQTTLTSFESSAAAAQKISAASENSLPAAILFVQSRPGQFAQCDIERLHALAPLARLVALLGPWCEGEARSGHPFL